METKKEFISKATLRDRGWTDAMISRFLPECDREANNPHYRCAPSMKLYSVSRVETIEASGDFLEVLQKSCIRKERLARAAIEKKQRMTAYASTVDLGIPLMGRDDVLDAALATYNGLMDDLLTVFGHSGIPEGYSPLTRDADPVFLASLSRSYLRSQAKDFRSRIIRNYGVKMVDEALAIIGSRISLKIDMLHPWIDDTLKDQDRYLFIDTETTGLDVRYHHLVQVAWILTDQKDTPITSGNFIIQPQGFSVPVSASRIHGITNRKAIAEGRPLREVLRLLSYSFDAATAIVGHNPAFDLGFLYDAAEETGICLQEGLCVYDTSDQGTAFCKLPSSSGHYQYRTPSLTDLHQILFGYPFKGAHDALADTEAARRCFWGLVQKKYIRL